MVKRRRLCTTLLKNSEKNEQLDKIFGVTEAEATSPPRLTGGATFLTMAYILLVT